MNQVWIAGEQRRHAFDDAGGVDASDAVSMLAGMRIIHIRSALEIFHDIQESIVHIRVVGKLDLDLIEIAERVLFEKYISNK